VRSVRLVNYVIIMIMILDDILKVKEQEVELLKKQFEGKDPYSLVKGLPKPRDFLGAFSKEKFSLIAEVKKASPSAGIICPDFNPTSLAKVYEESGASAISVLTDQQFFQGKLDYIKAVKDSTTIPVLRKDFIIDELQVCEAMIAGADAILLIVKLLDEKKLVSLLALAEDLGMQTLVEVHNSKELEIALKTDAKIIGINNRDLKIFKIDINNTITLIEKHPEVKERIIIAESGIKNREHIEILKKAGVNGVLIGESILKSGDIPKKIEELIG
jgi:indole-3-glycerol phosphate synthase